MPLFREEVLNIKVAELLKRFGLEAHPEIISNKKKPDVLIYMRGIKVILECKSASRVQSLFVQAKERLTTGIADISLAIVYPENINKAEDIVKLEEKLGNAIYNGKLYYWSDKGIEEIAIESKRLIDIAQLINEVFVLYLKESILQTKVAQIGENLEHLTDMMIKKNLFFDSDEILKTLKKILAIEN